MLKIIEGAVLLGALMLYLAPAMIADARERDDAFAVTIVNILLGWTVIRATEAREIQRELSPRQTVPEP
jgi:hypothetical protein